jgi:hypothetical protein
MSLYCSFFHFGDNRVFDGLIWICHTSKILIKTSHYRMHMRGLQLFVANPSDANGPRKTVPNNNCVRMGIRMNPWE